MRVTMLCDWHFFYAAALANSLIGQADVMIVARDHGYELGIDGDASTAKAALLEPRVQMSIVRGPQSDVSSLKSTAKVIDAIRRFEPDVVHHAQEHSDWRLLLAQLSARKVPMVLTIHDVVPHLGSAPAPNWLQKRVARKLRRDAAAYVVHGRALADELRTQPWYNGRTVYPIPHLPLRRVQAPEPLPERPTLLFFGRLEYYKGLDIFIRAVELAAARIPELRAIVAGRGVEATRCRGLVTKPELFDWREGFVAHDAVRNTFSEASVIVLPYREASQSGVIPLAFGFGRPVIATAVGGLPEVVENGVNGVLVPVAEPESIAQAIVTMVGDRDLLERLARGAMASVTEGDLSSRKVAEMHLRAYGEVASRAIR